MKKRKYEWWENKENESYLYEKIFSFSIIFPIVILVLVFIGFGVQMLFKSDFLIKAIVSPITFAIHTDWRFAKAFFHAIFSSWIMYLMGVLTLIGLIRELGNRSFENLKVISFGVFVVFLLFFVPYSLNS